MILYDSWICEDRWNCWRYCRVRKRNVSVVARLGEVFCSFGAAYLSEFLVCLQFLRLACSLCGISGIGNASINHHGNDNFWNGYGRNMTEITATCWGRNHFRHDVFHHQMGFSDSLPFDGLVQHCGISIATTLEMPQLCTKPLLWFILTHGIFLSVIVP